jgi:hypothetical protein
MHRAYLSKKTSVMEPLKQSQLPPANAPGMSMGFAGRDLWQDVRYAARKRRHEREQHDDLRRRADRGIEHAAHRRLLHHGAGGQAGNWSKGRNE